MGKPFNDIEKIYRLHSATVYRIAYAMLENKQDAEDATQVVFEKLVARWPPCPDDRLLGWLIVCTRNHCKDVLGSAQRKRRVACEPDALGAVPEADDRHEDLVDAVLSLPNDLKVAVVLYYHMGYSSVEIARLLDQPETTVRTHLGKARKILRGHLEGGAR